MNKNYIIVFGSAATKKFRHNHHLPSDIDVISDMPEQEVIPIVTEWGKKEFGTSLPVDLHPQSNTDCVRVPVLHEGPGGFIVIKGNPAVHTHIRKRGFASILRMYGDDPEKLLAKLKAGEKLSLLPETEKYSDSYGEDKYYSGLKAFRNAAAHVDNLDYILSRLNCGKLLKMLLRKDADNWMASSDITRHPLPYGDGWSLAVNINVSSDRTQPVLYGIRETKNEEEAIKILFR